MSELENIVITDADDGQRLDRWLKKHFSGVSFGQMQKILRTGQLRIDGKRAKGDARLVKGQIVRIPPQLRGIGVVVEREGVSPKDAAFIQSLVIYKDDDLIAINKPSGLATQGGSKINRHVDGMLDALRYGHEERPHLVHRLDKDTSGVLLLARSTAAAREMGHIFAGREIRKYYWAITVPAPLEAEGRIRSAIAKVEGRGGERMMAVDEDSGKMSLTMYHTVDSLGDQIAWVAFWPRTGRTHQIRVHAAQMGCPLLGDGKYGHDEADELVFNSILAGPEMASNLHLHARRLIFNHPRTGKKVDIVAPLDGHMKKTFAHLGFDYNDKTDHFKDVE